MKQIQDGKTGADDKLALQKLTDVEKRALKLWKEDFQDKDIASVSNGDFHRIPICAKSSRRFAQAVERRKNFFCLSICEANTLHFIYKRNFRSNGFVDEDETLHIFWKLMLLVFPKTMRHSFAFSEQRRKKIVFMA